MNLLPLKSEGSYLSAVVARGGDGEFFIFPSEMLFPFEDMGQTWPPVMGGAGCALLGAPAERGSEEARERGLPASPLSSCQALPRCVAASIHTISSVSLTDAARARACSEVRVGD